MENKIIYFIERAATTFLILFTILFIQNSIEKKQIEIEGKINNLISETRNVKSKIIDVNCKILEISRNELHHNLQTQTKLDQIKTSQEQLHKKIDVVMGESFEIYKNTKKKPPVKKDINKKELFDMVNKRRAKTGIPPL